MSDDRYQKNLALYDTLISIAPGIERKGKTMPYTSSNGHMFSQINKSGEIGIRLPEEHREAFHETHCADPFKSYGAVMKEYVLVPDSLLEQLDVVSAYLQIGFNYVNSLKPK
ncbi:MAG: hypothetical protein RIE53_00185 [Rhodothermales bacterium]